MASRFRNFELPARTSSFASPAGKCYWFRGMRVKVGVTGSAFGASPDEARARRCARRQRRWARGCVPPKRSSAVVIFDEDPERLLDRCLEELKQVLRTEG